MEKWLRRSLRKDKQTSTKHEARMASIEKKSKRIRGFTNQPVFPLKSCVLSLVLLSGDFDNSGLKSFGYFWCSIGHQCRKAPDSSRRPFTTITSRCFIILKSQLESIRWNRSRQSTIIRIGQPALRPRPNPARA